MRRDTKLEKIIGDLYLLPSVSRLLPVLKASATISGGSLYQLETYHAGKMDISDGSVSAVFANDGSTITVHNPVIWRLVKPFSGQPQQIIVEAAGMDGYKNTPVREGGTRTGCMLSAPDRSGGGEG